ncbi:coagulation factor X-like isoform X2 [Scyliorhinus canicula]|uniref:coagulation factor X-like isoform X2 n=1 Tax=Scyliorhinus canicula TaxID=7830 RepID=UPI0018F3EAA7|nr:coagulation factor X-like isoform X2 [Scyliorhinus canicula]
MAWILGLVLLSLLPTETYQQVFLPSTAARALLGRHKRENFLLEELRAGNLERECREEICNFEEAREVFEDMEKTWEFLRSYTAVKNGCLSSPCWNGGTCYTNVGEYNCTCTTGYSGWSCEIENDNCASNPCENGGWCQNSATYYKCSCETGYHGLNCELGPIDCSSHGQTCGHFCKLHYGTYICYCAQGYKLGEDKKSCIPEVPYPCGKVMVASSIEDADLILRAIDGDQQCKRGEYPWQVLLKHGNETFCAAAILNKDFVLTSADCANQLHPLTVVVGEHNLEVNEGSEQIHNVSQIHIHSRYSQATFENDIALLKLETSIEFNNYTIPICLPETDFAEFFLMKSEYGAVSGWKQKKGRIHQPIPLGVPYVPYVEFLKCEGLQHFPIVHRMFCAGFEELADPLCHLTRGSPFVTKHRDVWYLTGMSLGAAEYDCTVLPVYTKVSRYISWIKKTMAQSASGI